MPGPCRQAVPSLQVSDGAVVPKSGTRPRRPAASVGLTSCGPCVKGIYLLSRRNHATIMVHECESEQIIPVFVHDSTASTSHAWLNW